MDDRRRGAGRCTISDFRKDNIDRLKEIFYEFNRRISGAVEWGCRYRRE